MTKQPDASISSSPCRPVPTATIVSPSIRTSASNWSVAVTTRPPRMSRVIGRSVPGDMEHVWDYPRPPAVVPCERRVRVELGGETVADSTRALRVLEPSHPPVIYIPPEDVWPGWLAPSASRTTWCEYKGRAHYLSAVDRPD